MHLLIVSGMSLRHLCDYRCCISAFHPVLSWAGPHDQEWLVSMFLIFHCCCSRSLYKDGVVYRQLNSNVPVYILFNLSNLKSWRFLYVKWHLGPGKTVKCRRWLQFYISTHFSIDTYKHRSIVSQTTESFYIECQQNLQALCMYKNKTHFNT